LKVKNNTAENKMKYRAAGSKQDLRIVLSTHLSSRLTRRTGTNLCYCTVNILARRKVLTSVTLEQNHLCKLRKTNPARNIISAGNTH